MSGPRRDGATLYGARRGLVLLAQGLDIKSNIVNEDFRGPTYGPSSQLQQTVRSAAGRNISVGIPVPKAASSHPKDAEIYVPIKSLAARTGIATKIGTQIGTQIDQCTELPGSKPAGQWPVAPANQPPNSLWIG